MTATIPVQSDHFTYYKLANGVWAAIVKPSGLAASNSGIIDLGDQTLIFDTTFSPASAMELRTLAESLTGRTVTYVLNSHWHQDHVFGNAVFSLETEIYSTVRTSELIAEKIPNIMDEFKEHWPAQKKKWAEIAKNAKDEAERIDYEEGVQFAQSIIDTFPQLELRLPDKTITDRLEFKGTKRTAVFITFGGGHTASDAILWLPVERVIFTGDLLVARNHPDLTHGNSHQWLEILAKIKALDPVTLIPGHGGIASLEDIDLIERYINELMLLAKQTGDVQSPDFTEGWDNADAFEGNIKFLRERMLKYPD